MKRIIVLFLFIVGCVGCKTTWLGPIEPLDAMLMRDEITGRTNVVTYGFKHTSKNGGYLVWKMAPLPK